MISNQILTIFNDNKDKEVIKNLISIDLDKIPIGMTQFQIENFVLNRKEFSTPLMQYQQTKMELFTRDAMNTFSPETPIYPQETKNYRVTEYAVMKR